MVDSLIVIVLPWTKNTNIQRLKNMYKMRGKPEWNNMVFMSFNDKVILTMGNMTL